MSFFKPKKLATITIVYWILLLYMIAALGWWFIALEKQNREMANLKLNELQKDDPAYYSKVKKIEESTKRKTTQYTGEGFTFLALILLGAVFVFRAARRQLHFSMQQQNFMMAVTHELKTPIAVTQLNLETLQKRKLDEEKQQKLIANTLEEANRLNTLCNNILLTSQMEAGAYTAIKEEINLSDLIEGCVDNCKNRFPLRKIIEHITGGIYLVGEQWLLQMLTNNLLENAFKYSPKDSTVSIFLEEKNNMITLSVCDEGNAIPEMEKKKIFDKFYRMGNENARKSKGTGLGLYLCKKIAEGHYGSISVIDNYPVGSNFTVLFTSS